MNKDVIAKAETIDYFIEEIYKNLLVLRNGDILDNHDVDMLNSLLRSRFNDWCLANMDHKEYTKYVLRLFDRIKEELENE